MQKALFCYDTCETKGKQTILTKQFAQNPSKTTMKIKMKIYL